MSIKLMNAVTKNGPKNSSQRFVLLMIADNAADDGSNAFPAVETLADKTALSERTVIRAIEGLVADGYLLRRRRRGTSNIYQIVVSKLQDSVGDNLSSTVSDKLSLTEVTPCHFCKCQDVTPVSDTMSPDPSINHHINHQVKKIGRERVSESKSPSPPAVTVAFGQFDRTPGGKGYQLPADPPVMPPAARLMQKLTGYYPGADMVGYIAERLGDAPDETALSHVIREWRARGFKVNNYAGICDWYDQRVRNPQWSPPSNGRAAEQPVPQTVKMTPIAPGLY